MWLTNFFASWYMNANLNFTKGALANRPAQNVIADATFLLFELDLISVGLVSLCLTHLFKL